MAGAGTTEGVLWDLLNEYWKMAAARTIYLPLPGGRSIIEEEQIEKKIEVKQERMYNLFSFSHIFVCLS